MKSHPIPRRASRRPVRLAANCRTQAGVRGSGTLSDISPQGCCLNTTNLLLREGQRLLIRPDGIEGLTGVVRWIIGERAGVEFDAPLYEPVVDHLSKLFCAGKQVFISTG